ncbi:MAG: hypothetical protein QT08_C0011G0015 [archaeon GW2011_AR17]|nr:MAG: hypothetical protein QT08_C0011G0015 [archaeon GW2011_AR17]MBS3154472.1 hypothetical protein [Candidatus Woesearchaeota archaeon]HIH15119.1 hypothetical protein [Nanoarchaeota archaeon]HIH59393.1 hypothetical protein [Nanoarchaeota archaeon]HII14519.1 hypothetical protein [Nanoarchaeota archaeon]
MSLDEAKKTLSKAEAIMEKSYAFTRELKLLPIALQHLQSATEYAWRYNRGKKPKLLTDLEKITTKRKESPLEFKRKEKLIICTEDYKTTIIEEKIIKEYLKKTKRYIEKCKTKNQQEKN